MSSVRGFGMAASKVFISFLFTICFFRCLFIGCLFIFLPVAQASTPTPTPAFIPIGFVNTGFSQITIVNPNLGNLVGTVINNLDADDYSIF